MEFEEVRANGRVALLARTGQGLAPLGALRRVLSVGWQMFVPIERTTWTVVLIAMSPHDELSVSLRSLVLSMAESLSVEPGDEAFRYGR
jgi:hypothetical protein